MREADEAESALPAASATLRGRVADSVYRTFDSSYARVAGSPPDVRRWHFQRLAQEIVVRDLEPELRALRGRVLDVGCGEKPYGRWLSGADAHIGLDVTAGPTVDVVVAPDAPWPLADDSFDAVVCTQVLEHVRSPAHVVAELRRVLRPGGRFVVTVPFTYNVHGAPHDYRRWTITGVRELLEGLEVSEARPQGGIGSSGGVLVLNWLDVVLRASAARTLARLLLLPIWIAVCAVVNALGAILDRLDTTAMFYGNVIATGYRRS
jgi:SAM-dependent methyltransferase